MHKFFVLLAFLLLVDIIAYVVLHRNLREEIYSVDADSISIPLMQTAYLSAFAAVLLTVVVALSAFALRAARQPLASLWIVGPSIIALAISYLLAVVFFVIWAGFWLEPHHYAISVACGCALMAVLLLALLDFKALRTAMLIRSNQLRETV